MDDDFVDHDDDDDGDGDDSDGGGGGFLRMVFNRTFFRKPLRPGAPGVDRMKM